MWLNCAKDQSCSLFSVNISHHSVNEATVFTTYLRNITGITESNELITTGNNSPHVGGIQETLGDPGFHALDSRYQVLDSGFFVSGTWIRIPIVGGIEGFLELYSGFQTPRSSHPGGRVGGYFLIRG